MSELVNLSINMPSAYLEMMSKTAEVMPKITESTKAFYKSDSQVKNVSLNITELTDVGSASHILARIEQKKQALQESEIKVRKKQVKLARKKAELETVSGFDADNLELDILEIQTQIETIQNYQSGAIREVRFLVEQYEAICMRLGVEIITEEHNTMLYYVTVKGRKVLRHTTTGSFVKKYPVGTYIVTVRGHAFTIKDGVVIGNLADGKQMKKRINGAWKIG